WTWNGRDWTWRQPAASPPPRQLGAMAASPGGGVVLFGGSAPGDTSRTFGDTWLWDGDTWRQQLPAAAPAARSGVKMAADERAGRAVLFGGHDDGARASFDDTWAWDGATWTLAAEHGPGAPGDPALAFDRARGRVVLFGTFATAARSVAEAL